MYRSSSLSRSLDGFTVSPPPIKKNASAAAFDILPRYVQSTDEDEKKQPRFKAEHSVHFIPLVLILCGLLLWFAGGAAPHGDFALAKHDETMMSKNKSSNIGDVLKEKKTLIAGDPMNFKQLNNFSMVRERIQDSH